MNKCEWCGKNSDTLEIYTDAIGESHHICKSCKKDVDDCICRKCGAPTDPNMMIDGLCTNCVQVNMMEKNKKREAVRMGVDRDLLKSLTSDIELTDKDYEQWLTMKNSFSDASMKSSKELRRIWIMVKFNAAGIYDPSVIANNFLDIEAILDRNFSKLIGNKCKLIIGNNSETRKVIRQSETIDYENEVYIIAA